MKILHFLPWYTNSYVGGTEQYLINLAISQKNIGHTVEILQPNHEMKCDVAFVENLKVNLIAFPNSDIDSQFILGIASKYDFQDFQDFLLGFKADIIHFHGTEPRFVFFHDIINSLNIATVITPHLVAFSCPDGTLRQNGSKQCNGKVEMLKCSVCLVAKNKKIPQFYKRFSPIIINLLFEIIPFNLIYKYKLFSLTSRIFSRLNFLRFLGKQSNIRFDALNNWYSDVLISNMIKKEVVSMFGSNFSDERKYLELNKKRNEDILNFLFVGRISRSKGVHTIVDAIKHLDLYKHKFSLTLIGDLCEREIESEIFKLNSVGYKIMLNGVLPNSVVRSKMKEYDYLLFPSLDNEMLPLTIQEAIESDLPIIASDLLGCKSLVKDGVNGFIFISGDFYDLATLLKEIIENNKSIKFEFDKTLDNKLDRLMYYENLYSEMLSLNLNC